MQGISGYTNHLHTRFAVRGGELWIKRGAAIQLQRNSLMLHGMIYAQHHKYLDKDPANDFRNEIGLTSAQAHSCRKCTSRRRY
jgi:hypothetical protein